MRAIKMVTLVGLLVSTVVGQTCDNARKQGKGIGEVCVANSDCLNSELRGDAFQPNYEKERHNVEEGLTCLDDDAGVKRCQARRSHGQRCDDHENCKSRMCYPEGRNDSVKMCYGVGSIKLGRSCPFHEDFTVSTSIVQNVCQGDGHCWPSDLTIPATPATKVRTCTAWDKLGDSCSVLWGVNGNTTVPMADTCDPFFEELYCQPDDPKWTGPTGTGPFSYKQLMTKGRCVELPVRDEDESCKKIEGTNVRPGCEYDQFCNENGGEVCKELADEFEQCFSDTDCVNDFGCNIVDAETSGVCIEFLSLKEGAKTRHARFCEVGLHMQNGVCTRDKLGNECENDIDCITIGGTAAEEVGQLRLYCNKAEGAARGTCMDLVPRDKCEDEYEKYVFYAAQEAKIGRLIQRRSCFDGGCFSIRTFRRQMKTYGENLLCCVSREQEDESCLSQARGVYVTNQMWNDVFFGDSKWQFRSSRWLSVDESDQEGDVCPPQGLSTLSIVLTSVVLGFVGLIAAFVLITEFVVYPRKAKESGSKASSSTSADSVPVAEEEMQPANNNEPSNDGGDQGDNMEPDGSENKNEKSAEAEATREPYTSH